MFDENYYIYSNCYQFISVASIFSLSLALLLLLLPRFTAADRRCRVPVRVYTCIYLPLSLSLSLSRLLAYVRALKLLHAQGRAQKFQCSWQREIFGFAQIKLHCVCRVRGIGFEIWPLIRSIIGKTYSLLIRAQSLHFLFRSFFEYDFLLKFSMIEKKVAPFFGSLYLISCHWFLFVFYLDHCRLMSFIIEIIWILMNIDEKRS